MHMIELTHQNRCLNTIIEAFDAPSGVDIK